MFFVKYNPESDTRGKVTFIHYNPVLLSDQEKLTGIMLESSIPQAEVQAGKIAILYINPETNELWYEYEDRPLSPEEEITSLKAQNAQIVLALVMNDLM